MQRNMGEHLYLNMVKRILNYGRITKNRTGILTKSIFGGQLNFDLQNSKLAMLTTKHISFDNVATELFWFLRGETNQKWLENRNVHIWRDNSTAEFLKSRNLHQQYREYESLGPIYGFQWRHFGAEYTDCHDTYKGCGFDQLQNVLDLIKHQPDSRRIIMTAWNPNALAKMVLPPCHVLVQFEVDKERGKLSAHMYQRSGDLMLGIPYNLLSYSLLTHILARKCNLTAGALICSYGNIHIYQTHVQEAYKQITRYPFKMPTLEMNFNPSIDVEQLELKHFKVNNYKHHKRIMYKMIA